MSNTTTSLAGKGAFITGGASGLGLHFAKLLAANGARVVVGGRRRELLDEACRQIEAAGGTARAQAMDVKNAGSVGEAVEAAREAGCLDIVVNNAGVAVAKPVLELTEEDWDHVVDTNLKGTFLVAQAAARCMVAAGTGGSIVNIASILGFRVAGQVAPYAASKAGVLHLTKAMSLELARWGIRVNALCPGYMKTDINEAFFDTDAGHALVKRIPTRRLGQPGELDGALLLLASDAGSYITGTAIAVDGGHLVSSL